MRGPYQLISLVTTMDVHNNFSNDRNIGGRYANGDLAELMVFNHAYRSRSSNGEGYLAEKWGLGSLPSTHSFKSSLTTPVSKSITSAATASATVGTVFTYTITTDVTNLAFQAANLPQGLSCNLGTGVISGTSAGGTYLVTLAAQSST